MAAEEVFPLGAFDATRVNPLVDGKPLPRFRVAYALADPFVTNARLRLVSVNGTYRLPVSNPATSDELETLNATMTDMRARQDDLLSELVSQLRTLNGHLASITDEEIENDYS